MDVLDGDGQLLILEPKKWLGRDALGSCTDAGELDALQADPPHDGWESGIADTQLVLTEFEPH